MREIKFRAWDTKPKQMAEPFELHYISSIMASRIKDESYALMQFTGLKDKNGKEIYEGDIIAGISGIGRRDNKPSVIDFVDGVFGFKGTSFPEGASEYNWTVKEAEIIGNIHESPELLQTPKE